MLPVDQITWAQTLLLHDQPALAAPKTLHYRLLHVAARRVRGGRRLRLRLRLDRQWPRAAALATAFGAAPPCWT